MQISPVKSINEGLIASPELNAEIYKGKSSIDLNIKEILYKDKNNKVFSTNNYDISPQETVCLLSNEIIDVKPGYIAYVFLKNRVSQKGILAFNTGIIDGGYKGPISTIITNYSSKTFSINELPKLEREFFRVVFHQVEVTNDERDSVEQTNYDYETYKKYRIKDLKNLPRLFLDRERLKTQINRELSKKVMNLGVGNVSLMFGLIALLFVFLPPLSKVVNIPISRYIDSHFSKEALKSDKLDKRLEALEKKVALISSK